MQIESQRKHKVRETNNGIFPHWELKSERDEPNETDSTEREHNGTFPVCVQCALLWSVSGVSFRPAKVQPDRCGDTWVPVAIICQPAAGRAARTLELRLRPAKGSDYELHAGSSSGRTRVAGATPTDTLLHTPCSLAQCPSIRYEMGSVGILFAFEMSSSMATFPPLPIVMQSSWSF